MKDAGISVCSGGILGLGGEEKDRIGLLHELASLKGGHPESVPINALVAVEGADPALLPHDEPSGSLWSAGGFFLVGMALIVAGGVVLVDAAVDIAGRLGVSDTVIGLTIVAAGTSLPELATTIIAAIRKQGDIALGNVLGSNIFNIFFIGGITGLVAPGPIPGGILQTDLWILLAAAVAAIVFAYTGGRLGRREGGVLLASYVLFILFTAGLLRF